MGFVDGLGLRVVNWLAGNDSSPIEQLVNSVVKGQFPPFLRTKIRD